MHIYTLCIPVVMSKGRWKVMSPDCIWMFHWTIHNCTKFASSSRFKYNFNTLIFSLIGHELSEQHEFYKMCPEMEIFRGMASVLQTAITVRVAGGKRMWSKKEKWMSLPDNVQILTCQEAISQIINNNYVTIQNLPDDLQKLKDISELWTCHMLFSWVGRIQ